MKRGKSFCWQQYFTIVSGTAVFTLSEDTGSQERRRLRSSKSKYSRINKGFMRDILKGPGFLLCIGSGYYTVSGHGGHGSSGEIENGALVIFKQEQTGLNGKVFTQYKFRTMTDEKDEEGNLLPDDVRLTKFGKLLRSTSLVEMQEFYILKRTCCSRT